MGQQNGPNAIRPNSDRSRTAGAPLAGMSARGKAHGAPVLAQSPDGLLRRAPLLGWADFRAAPAFGILIGLCCVLVGWAMCHGTFMISF